MRRTPCCRVSKKTYKASRTLIFLFLHVRQPNLDLARERRFFAELEGVGGPTDDSMPTPGVKSIAQS